MLTKVIEVQKKTVERFNVTFTEKGYIQVENFSNWKIS